MLFEEVLSIGVGSVSREGFYATESLLGEWSVVSQQHSGGKIMNKNDDSFPKKEKKKSNDQIF